MPRTSTHWLGNSIVLITTVAGLCMAALWALKPLTAALLGPIAWIGDIWQGESQAPMRDQLPAFSTWTQFGVAALTVALLIPLVLVDGRVRNKMRLASRISMAMTGLVVYLALLATPLPYVATRAIFSIIAMGLIFGARLVRKLRSIKTILFFIGVAYTCESLLWSLADESATLIGFGLFTLIALFFTRIDQKRAFKTSCFATGGSLVLVVAAGQALDAPPWTTVIAAVLTASAAAVAIRTLLQRRRNADDVSCVKDRAQVFDTSPEGLSDMSYPHIEALGRRGSRIVYHAPELLIAKDPNSGLTMFKVSSVFGHTDSVLIGCGTPNLAVSVHDDIAGTWKRMSAFMLYREKSHVAELDELQVGVYFELQGLSADTRRRLLESMHNHSGQRGPSCAHLNAQVLSEAGFSLGGGRNITRVIRPSRLANLIWRFGLEHEGETVNIRVVNTSKLEVGDHFIGVWRKEANSPIRLVRKALKRKRAKVDVAPLPQQPIVLRQKTWSGIPVTVWMNRPNAFGMLLTLIWGRHPEYKVAIAGLLHSPELTTPLESFPGKLNWLSRAKKHFLFSKPVVAGINKVKNKSFDRYDEVPIDAALEMMSPVSDHENRVLWNFALILLDDTYEIRLSPLKNQDPLSQDSKLRKVTNWILAKHVVATGYDERTVYAGEAWVQRSTDRSVHLCLNDNSGTYKPTVEQLMAVGALLGGLGIEVQTHPRETA